MAVRSAPRKGPVVHVVELPRSALIEDVTDEVRSAGLSLERFIELGRLGELHNDRLRDLWLMAGPAFE